MAQQLLASLEDKYQLPSGLLNAVMKQESGGNVNAISPKGAKGAFQFMDATAKQYGVDPHDLNSSADGAARMYSDLLKAHNGDLDKALASYNYGQGNVAKHGMDKLPKETQDYIVKVKAKMPKQSNPFDKFDSPENTAVSQSNPFDQFDSAPIQKEKPKETKNYSTSEIPLEALKNAPSSAVSLVKGIGQALVHPIDTVTGLATAAVGGIDNIMPDKARSAALTIHNALTGDNATLDNWHQDDRQVANQVGQFYKDRYGNLQKVKNTLATDPIGSLADASVVLGGAGAVANTAKVGKVAEALKGASNVVNPINHAVKLASGATNLSGKVASTVIGDVTTGAGAESIKQAYIAGKNNFNSFKDAVRDGKSLKEAYQTTKNNKFADNMRGDVPTGDVVDTASSALDEMIKDKNREYKYNIAKTSKDKSKLDFYAVDKAVADTKNLTTYKDKIIDENAAKIQKQIAEVVDDWKKSDSSYHTPEGFDALKKKIGGIVDTIPYEQKVSTKVGTQIYNAVKNEIVKQSPDYAKTMKDYAESEDLIREIRKTLSIPNGKKGSTDAAMRKLQSLMRNNVNSNYGNRLDIAKTLESKSGKEILPVLAGQSLNSLAPRGLSAKLLQGGGAGAAIYAHNPWALGAIPFTIPRVMGEAAYGTGKIASALSGFKPNPAELSALYQAGRLPLNKDQ